MATIGVYGFDGESFLRRLQHADVRLLLDVRQRRGVRGPDYAWANARRLRAALALARIAYEHHPELAPTTELDAVVRPVLLDAVFDDWMGRGLLGAAARLCDLCAFMSFDSAEQGLAHRYFVQALRLTHAIGDRALGGHVLICRALCQVGRVKRCPRPSPWTPLRLTR